MIINGYVINFHCRLLDTEAREHQSAVQGKRQLYVYEHCYITVSLVYVDVLPHPSMVIVVIVLSFFITFYVAAQLEFHSS